MTSRSMCSTVIRHVQHSRPCKPVTALDDDSTILTNPTAPPTWQCVRLTSSSSNDVSVFTPNEYTMQGWPLSLLRLSASRPHTHLPPSPTTPRRSIEEHT